MDKVIAEILEKVSPGVDHNPPNTIRWGRSHKLYDSDIDVLGKCAYTTNAPLYWVRLWERKDYLSVSRVRIRYIEEALRRQVIRHWKRIEDSIVPMLTLQKYLPRDVVWIITIAAYWAE
jgi:hypothetical protein